MRVIVSLAFFRNDASGYESERAGDARGRFFINFLPTLVREEQEKIEYKEDGDQG